MVGDLVKKRPDGCLIVGRRANEVAPFEDLRRDNAQRGGARIETLGEFALDVLERRLVACPKAAALENSARHDNQ